jgi:hypothetical protein
VLDKNQLKNIVLDDSAEIFKPRQEQTEKQKMSEMTFKEKVTYFNNYYRTTVIIAILAIAITGYFIYSIASPKPETILYAAIINSNIDPETAAVMQDDFGKRIDIDSKTQEVMFDVSFYLSNENASEYSLSSEQKLGTYLFAGQIDVMIAPESVFANYVKLGSFSKLSDELPTDLLTELTDSFYYSDTKDDPVTGAYGIHLDGAKIYNEKGELVDKPVLGIITNSKFKQNGVEFIKYLFDME